MTMIVNNDQVLTNLSHGDQLSLLTDVLVTLRAALMKSDDLSLPQPIHVPSNYNL